MPGDPELVDDKNAHRPADHHCGPIIMRLGNLMWGPPRVLDVSPGNRQPRLLHCGTSRARRFLLGETLMCPVLVACMQAGITNAWLRPVRCVRWSARSRS